MGGNNSKRGSYDLEKSTKKAASKKLKTEKAISFVNLTEQEIYEDLFPFRRRSTKRRRNVQEEDPRPYSVAVMEDNCYDDSVVPLKRTSMGSDSETLKCLECRDTKSEPILYNESHVEENLPEDVPQVPPRGISINQNEGYVYSVEDFPQQYQYSLQTRYMDVPNEPIRTFMSDDTSVEERQYHSIQENPKRNEPTLQRRRASCPEILLETEDNSYFPNKTEYYFQTISQRELHENHKDQRRVSGSSSTSSGMSEVERGLKNEERNIVPNTNKSISYTQVDFDLELNENEIDPCRIYDTITSSNVLQPYEIQLINDWLSKAQADCYINRENDKKPSNNFITSLPHNEEDFFTAASDSLPSCTGSRSARVTFDETIIKRVYSESSETDESNEINQRRDSDTSSLTSSDADGSIKYSSGYRYRDEKGTIYSEDGYKSSEEDTEDSDEDTIKMREQQIKLLMSNSIISAESIEQLRNNYQARMNEQKDLHVISETEEEDEDENFYDALDQEHNKELIEFMDQYPSFNGSSDGNYLDRLNSDDKDNDYLDTEVQNSFAKFETLCQTEKLRFDVQCEWEVQSKYPILVRDLDDFSLSSETIVNDNNLIESKKQEECDSEVPRDFGEKQNEGPEHSKSSDGSIQDTGTDFLTLTKTVEKLEPVYHIPYESDIISKPHETMHLLEYEVPNDTEDGKTKTQTLENENVNFELINTNETEYEEDYLQKQAEEDLFSNYEYINSLMKKSKQTEALTSSNDFDDSNLQKDKLVSTEDKDNTVTDSGQILHTVQVEETCESKVFNDDNVVYPVPDEPHELEETYTSDNFDFEQGITYEFIHNQQLIYPVKIKDDHVNDEASNTKYKVTSYDPNISTDADVEILKPFDEKSIGLLPNDVDIQLRTSEGFDTTITSDEDKNKFKPSHSIMETNDDENLENGSSKTFINEEEVQHRNVFLPELQKRNKFFHKDLTNPFLNDLEHQMENKLINNVQNSAIIAPIPKPRKNPPKSNNLERITNDALQDAPRSYQPKLEKPSDWSVVNNDLNSGVDNGFELSYILNKDYSRKELPQQVERDHNVWINNQDTGPNKIHGYEDNEDAFPESRDASRVTHNQEDSVKMDVLSSNDLNFDLKSKSETDKELLVDEDPLVRWQDKNDEQEESPSTERDNSAASIQQSLKDCIYDDVSTNQRELGNQLNVKDEVPENVKVFNNVGFNFEDTFEIEEDNSIDGENNSILLDYLKSKVFTDSFDTSEHLHIDNDEKNTRDNVDILSTKESEWVSNESTLSEIQILPTINYVGTSVVYYEQFQYPIITEKKDQKREENVSYQSNISLVENENNEIMDNDNQKVELRNSSIIQEKVNGMEVNSENVEANVHPVHILKNNDQDLSLNRSDASAEIFPVRIKADSETKVKEDYVNHDIVEDLEQNIKEYESFNEPSELYLVKESASNSEHPIAVPKPNLSKELCDAATDSLQGDAPNKTNVHESYFTETESLQDVRLEPEIDFSKPSLTELSINEIDEMQLKVVDSPNVPNISDTDKIQKDLNRLSPVQHPKGFKDMKEPFASRKKYTLTQPVIHQSGSDDKPIFKTHPKPEEDSLVDTFKRNETSCNDDCKQDISDDINKNTDGTASRKSLSQIFRNRQKHDRPKSTTDLIRKVEFNSHSRRSKSNPEEKTETPKNSNNNQIGDSYLQDLFSKISNTKALNMLEQPPSADVIKFNRKHPASSTPEDTTSDVEQTEIIGNEAIDNPQQKTANKKNATTLDNFRENFIVKEESDEELELEKILQDLDIISDEIKSSNDLNSNVNMDDLYIKLLRMRVAVHKIKNDHFNYNLMTMQREARKKIRSLLKDIENAEIR